MLKLAKPDLSDLENYLKSNRIKFVSQFIRTIPGNLQDRINKRLLNSLFKWLKCVKMSERGKFRPFRYQTMTFIAIPSNPTCGS